jgi:hypothetical protein
MKKQGGHGMETMSEHRQIKGKWESIFGAGNPSEAISCEDFERARKTDRPTGRSTAGSKKKKKKGGSRKQMLGAKSNRNRSQEEDDRVRASAAV